MDGPPADARAIEEEVLAAIRPDPATRDRLEAARRHLLARAEAAAREIGSPVVRCLVAGSAARGTYLRDRMDIDLFLLFPPPLPRDDFERAGLALARAILPRGEMRYAEHPYLRGEFEGFAVEAVPGYAVEDSARPQSAVDRTPFHQAYVTERLTPEGADQVRLSKQFLRALGVYGSDARTGGFSGYLIELLLLRFGSFRALLTAARSWRIPVTLLTAPKAPPRLPETVALVLDDPVDPERNVASALSRRNLALFVLAAGAYLDRPVRAAFEIPPPRPLDRRGALERVAERGTHVEVLALDRPDVVDDILFPQLRKAERGLVEEAERLGFCVVGSAAAADPRRAVLVIEVEHPRLPAVKVQDGPPAGLDRVDSFLQKWGAPDAPVLQGPYVTADGRLAVEVRRRERDLGPLLTEALVRLPLGRDLKRTLPAETRLRPLPETEEEPVLAAALADLLEKRLPWLGARGSPRASGAADPTA